MTDSTIFSPRKAAARLRPVSEEEAFATHLVTCLLAVVFLVTTFGYTALILIGLFLACAALATILRLTWG